MLRKIYKQLILIVFIMGGAFVEGFSQTFEISGQIRPRIEYRHGQKTPFTSKQDPAFLISQRTRLTLDYSSSLFKSAISLQDVTLWGDVAGNSTKDINSFMINQAWGELFLAKEFSLKLGRQAIAYDDQRLFSGSDWTQQARRHDAFLMKFSKNDTKFDIGLAYNQSQEKQSGAQYTVDNYYQNMEYLWIHHDLKDLGISFTFANIGKVDSVHKPDQKTFYTQTFGPYLTYKFDKLKLSGAFYYQMGKIKEKTDKNAMFGSFDLNYAFTKDFNAGFAFQYFSGNNQTDKKDDKDNEFVPLYGSGHKFNGWMDYFYAGSGHGKAGLINFALPLSYKKDKFSAEMQLHHFLAAAKVSDGAAAPAAMSANLGTEVGLQLNYAFSKEMTLSAGYSQMFGTKTLEKLKGGDMKVAQNWAWMQFSFTPSFFKYTKE